MPDSLLVLERVARLAHRFSEAESSTLRGAVHPFEARDIDERFPSKVRRLFDDGHYPEATFAAFKFLDKEVQRVSGVVKTGEALMMEVFKEDTPRIRLTPCVTMSEKDEQRGYRFLFAGGVVAIRNPRGHEDSLADDPETCLNHLSFATMLLRRLELAERSNQKPGSAGPGTST
jgi:uncharacterized protein (TIGR02391 family)